ncbi:GNAT family N-acetyltransferase [Nonomuraea dietziae]|uniref:GNAT family N-acetyltransferase n=1 Tax=Nonomuraea dietziae TaxID=65515 RepID=UPI00342939E7
MADLVWIDPAARGQGIATEAATAVREEAAGLGAATIVARHHPANVAPGRIMTNLGMHRHDDGTNRYGRPCRISILPLRPPQADSPD